MPAVGARWSCGARMKDWRLARGSRHPHAPVHFRSAGQRELILVGTGAAMSSPSRVGWAHGGRCDRCLPDPLGVCADGNPLGWLPLPKKEPDGH